MRDMGFSTARSMQLVWKKVCIRTGLFFIGIFTIFSLVFGGFKAYCTKNARADGKTATSTGTSTKEESMDTDKTSTDDTKAADTKTDDTKANDTNATTDGTKSADTSETTTNTTADTTTTNTTTDTTQKSHYIKIGRASCRERV